MFKVNSIKTLLSRAKHVCSTFTALNKELSFLVQYFHNNGYPKPLQGVYSQEKSGWRGSRSGKTLILEKVRKKSLKVRKSQDFDFIPGKYSLFNNYQPIIIQIY